MYKKTLLILTLMACMVEIQCAEGDTHTPPPLGDDDDDNDNNNDNDDSNDDNNNDDEDDEDNDNADDNDESGGDTDVDSDTDGDADADSDSGGDSDADMDSDVDSDTDGGGCPINSGFPCACNADPCDDGGSCLTFSSGGAQVGFCSTECSDSTGCSDTMGFGDSGECLVDTTSDSAGDHCTLLCTEGGNPCPDGLTCQAVSDVDWMACF